MGWVGAGGGRARTVKRYRFDMDIAWVARCFGSLSSGTDTFTSTRCSLVRSSAGSVGLAVNWVYSREISYGSVPMCSVMVYFGLLTLKLFHGLGSVNLFCCEFSGRF